MAARKKKKENRIKDEKKRLKEIFAELEENKRNLVTPLIEKAAFMSIELDDLQETIEQEGWTYIALSKNYAAVIKQLTELVPAAKRKASRLAALRDE